MPSKSCPSGAPHLASEMWACRRETPTSRIPFFLLFHRDSLTQPV
jgi:hypothetical protein